MVRPRTLQVVAATSPRTIRVVAAATSPRTIQVVAAASPRPVSTDDPRRGRRDPSSGLSEAAPSALARTTARGIPKRTRGPRAGARARARRRRPRPRPRPRTRILPKAGRRPASRESRQEQRPLHAVPFGPVPIQRALLLVYQRDRRPFGYAVGSTRKRVAASPRSRALGRVPGSASRRRRAPPPREGPRRRRRMPRAADDRVRVQEDQRSARRRASQRFGQRRDLGRAEVRDGPRRRQVRRPGRVAALELLGGHEGPERDELGHVSESRRVGGFSHAYDFVERGVAAAPARARPNSKRQRQGSRRFWRRCIAGVGFRSASGSRDPLPLGRRAARGPPRPPRRPSRP